MKQLTDSSWFEAVVNLFASKTVPPSPSNATDARSNSAEAAYNSVDAASSSPDSASDPADGLSSSAAAGSTPKTKAMSDTAAAVCWALLGNQRRAVHQWNRLQRCREEAELCVHELQSLAKYYEAEVQSFTTERKALAEQQSSIDLDSSSPIDPHTRRAVAWLFPAAIQPSGSEVKTALAVMQSRICFELHRVEKARLSATAAAAIAATHVGLPANSSGSITSSSLLKVNLRSLAQAINIHKHNLHNSYAVPFARVHAAQTDPAQPAASLTLADGEDMSEKLETEESPDDTERDLESLYSGDEDCEC